MDSKELQKRVDAEYAKTVPNIGMAHVDVHSPQDNCAARYWTCPTCRKRFTDLNIAAFGKGECCGNPFSITDFSLIAFPNGTQIVAGEVIVTLPLLSPSQFVRVKSGNTTIEVKGSK